MGKAELKSASPAAGPPGFADRPPSQAWEAIAGPTPQHLVWAWFKPATIPNGLILRLPDANTQPPPVTWTMRTLALAAGLDPRAVAMWMVYGVPHHGMNGANPLLDAPIPRPVPGLDPQIAVVLNAPLCLAPAGGGPITDPTMLELYERIETDWTASIELERDLGRLRKQLLDLLGRLKSLNRDLTPVERLHSNSQDKKDWLEARRHLRDGALRLWKCIKTYDIGDTSAAGQRKWFEDTFERFILPRRPFDAIHQAHREYAQHRKMVQTLHNEMTSAHTTAQMEGERRAQQVMNVIATKVREATKKKNFLGIMMGD